jgi:indolepyruvate ferredoxin oxidoreductase, alpha subunit
MKKNSQKKILLMGNTAIAIGAVDNGCTVAAAYPGTPSSEIVSSIARLKLERSLKIHVEWSVNEKAAYEVALSNSYMGCRSIVAMKQVGLNVAADPLMSSAYTGGIGGFIVVACDDPGPQSSQTEQDSRILAMLAKIPVLDPSSPQEAYAMVATALSLSEKFAVPVMLRPTTSVCHARQDIALVPADAPRRKSSFARNPQRWAATPKYRFKLHGELNRKLDEISVVSSLMPQLTNRRKSKQPYAVIASGVAYALASDALDALQLHDSIALIKIPMPYPLSSRALIKIINAYERLLVLEETYPVIELQLPERSSVWGRLNGFVPREGELTPDSVHTMLSSLLHNKKIFSAEHARPAGQRPSLCPGCPHRAAFFSIKKALPKALFPGDIGCYTLGINLGAVDTCLCMGASINQAAGFYHSFAATGSERSPIVATIGDSTFFHSGVSALINSVYTDARFILVILDNSTTAMTGNQPTAATGQLADGTRGKCVSIEQVVKGCGIEFLRIVDPYDIALMIKTVQEAEPYTRQHDGGIAVIIARHPCVMLAGIQNRYSVSISSECTGCQYCVTHFECPALSAGDGHVTVNQLVCNGCGTCVSVCPIQAITLSQR